MRCLSCHETRSVCARSRGVGQRKSALTLSVDIAGCDRCTLRSIVRVVTKHEQEKHRPHAAARWTGCCPAMENFGRGTQRQLEKALSGDTECLQDTYSAVLDTLMGQHRYVAWLATYGHSSAQLCLQCNGPCREEAAVAHVACHGVPDCCLSCQRCPRQTCHLSALRASRGPDAQVHLPVALSI